MAGCGSNLSCLGCAGIRPDLPRADCGTLANFIGTAGESARDAGSGAQPHPCRSLPHPGPDGPACPGPSMPGFLELRAVNGDCAGGRIRGESPACATGEEGGPEKMRNQRALADEVVRSGSPGFPFASFPRLFASPGLTGAEEAGGIILAKPRSREAAKPRSREAAKPRSREAAKPRSRDMLRPQLRHDRPRPAAGPSPSVLPA